MSSEVNNNSSSLGSYLLFPTVTTAGSALSAVKTHRGVQNALKAQNHEAFKNISTTMKNNGADVFTRSSALATGYDSYKSVAKSKAKTAKKMAKLEKKGDLSLAKKFTNKIKDLFNKETTDFNTLKTQTGERLATDTQKLNKMNSALNKASSNFDAKALDEALDVCEKEVVKQGEKTVTKNVVGKGAFQNAQEITKNLAQEGSSTFLKATAKNTKGLMVSAGNNFKKELSFKTGKFNYIMTAVSFVPNIINKVIPEFKNNGFKAGVSALGKTFVQAGTDLVSYAAGGAVGRALGTAIGTIICPGAGSAIGGQVGDMIGSMVVGSKATEVVSNTLKMNEDSQSSTKAQTNTTTVAKNSNPSQNSKLESYYA